MNPVNRNTFFIKEHAGLLKASNNYDILDPESEQLIMQCRELSMPFLARILRFTQYKRFTPFHVHILTDQDKPVLSVKRGITLVGSKVVVMDSEDRPIGMFKQKLFSFTSTFDVLDMEGNVICQLKGKWTQWDFKFIKDNIEFAHVSKKWGGMAREIFTSADNYMLHINEAVPKNDPMRLMILAAVVCIDMVLKE